MEELELYQNYGVLGSEKKSTWTYGNPAETAISYDKRKFKLPYGWELVELQIGGLALQGPSGRIHEINKSLCGDDDGPRLTDYDMHWNARTYTLTPVKKKVEEIPEASIFYDNDTTKSNRRVQSLRDADPKDMKAEELFYMSTFVCPAKIGYDIRQNPYTRELCSRAGTFESLMSDDNDVSKTAVDDAYKKFGLNQKPAKRKKR